MARNAGAGRDARRQPRAAVRRLLGELEARAAALGARSVWLDMNRALTEAIVMYRSAGFAEVPAFSAEPFADHWFEKPLPGG